MIMKMSNDNDNVVKMKRKETENGSENSETVVKMKL